MRTLLSIFMTAILSVSVLTAQSKSAVAADSITRYSIRASYGVQPLISPSAKGLSDDINKLNLDRKHPLFSTSVSENYPAVTIGATIYGLNRKNLFVTLSYTQQRYDRTSSFIFQATDINGNPSDRPASIYSDHRTHSIMLGGGWSSHLSNSGMVTVEASCIYLLGTIDETMTVSGFREVKSTIDGSGAGGRFNAGLSLPLFGPVSLRLDGNFTLTYVWYNT
ncbi:MAG: hypothetical protein KA247_05680, partial [Bacteroidetes bacterium]|nr:hypothetical protein [Bacteroidota bacterium]